MLVNKITRMTAAKTRWQAYFFLLINTLTWGAAFVITKPAFDVTTPFRFLLYRHALALLLTLPLLWHYWPKILKLGKKMGTIIGLELVGNTLALSLLYEGLKRTNVVEANLLSTSLPIFVILGGIFLLKEKQEKHEWLGLSIAVIATMYLTVFPLLMTGSVDGISVLGNVLVIASNVANMFYFPLAKRAYREIPKFLVTTISFWVATVSYLLLSLVELGGSMSTFITQISLDFAAPSVWIAVGYMAIFGSIIGLTAYIKGQDGIEASEASFFYYLQPLVYLPLAYWFLGESVTMMQIISLLFIFIGVGIAEQRPKHPNRTRATKKT